MKNKLLLHDGSAKDIPEIPRELKDIYKTAYEISNRVLIDMAADRGAFIDQSQSLNLFLWDPEVPKITTMIFYAWEKGLKGAYYLRSNAATRANDFAIDPKLAAEERMTVEEVTSSIKTAIETRSIMRLEAAMAALPRALEREARSLVASDQVGDGTHPPPGVERVVDAVRGGDGGACQRGPNGQADSGCLSCGA